LQEHRRRGIEMKSGKLVSLLVLLLALAAGLAGGWAQGVQGVMFDGDKNYEVSSEQWTRIDTGDVVATATFSKREGSRWIGLAEAAGQVKVMDRLKDATAIACIQIFKVMYDPKASVQKRFSLEEESTFAEEFRIEISTKHQKFKEIVLFVPASEKDPAHFMELTADLVGKGYLNIDGFTVAVDAFDGAYIKFRCKAWPSGDPIIFWI
jgi:hypothetical protein